MPQNTIWRIYQKPAVERPLPPNLLSADITAPTVIKTGPGTYYGYHITQNASFSRVQLRISDTANAVDRPPTPTDPITDFVRVDCGNVSDGQLYGLYDGQPYPAWLTPPYGQAIIPFINGLSVLSLPPGLALTIWYL